VAYQWLAWLSNDITTENIAGLISKKLSSTVVRNLSQHKRSAFYCVPRAVKVVGPRILSSLFTSCLEGQCERHCLDIVVAPNGVLGFLYLQFHLVPN
jgi:hypothetical protein